MSNDAQQDQLALALVPPPAEPEVIATGAMVPADSVTETAPAAAETPAEQATPDAAAPTEPAADAQPAVKHTCGMCRQMVKKKADDENGVCRRVFGKRVTVKTPACPQPDVDPELVKKYAPPPPKPSKAQKKAPARSEWQPHEKTDGPPATVIVARVLPGEGEVQQWQTVVTMHREGQMPTAWEQGPFANLLTLVASVARQHFERASAGQDEDEGAAQTGEEPPADLNDQVETGETADKEEEAS